MNYIIVLIAPTHLDLSPTRFTCLSEFACIHLVIWIPHFPFFNLVTQASPKYTHCSGQDSQNLLFGNNWTPQDWISYLHFTNYVIALIAATSNLTSNKWECVSAKSLQLSQTLQNPGTVAHQTPLSVGFSRQEYWSGLPYPPLGG